VKERKIPPSHLHPSPTVKNKKETLHTMAQRVLDTLVRRRMTNLPLWMVDAKEARGRWYRALWYLKVTNGLYYMESEHAQELVGSDAGSGVHAWKWYDNERKYANVTTTQFHGGRLLFDDHIPISIYDGSLNGKAVNTGEMDAYLKKAAISALSLEHKKECLSRNPGWQALAAGCWFRGKDEMLQALSASNALRLLGFAAPPPLMIAPMIPDCSGEAYLLHAWNHGILLMQGGAVPIRQYHAPLCQSELWLQQQGTSVVVLDTMFTRNPREGNSTNVGDARALIVAAATAVYSDSPGVEAPWRSQLWLMSLKTKSGECGHFCKGPWLSAASTTEAGRDLWAPQVGLVGVGLLALEALGQSGVTGEQEGGGQCAAFSGIISAIKAHRPRKLEPLLPIPYSLFTSSFPKPARLPERVHGILLQSLKATQLHSTPPVLDSRGFLNIGHLARNLSDLDLSLESDGDYTRAEAEADARERLVHAAQKRLEKHMSHNWGALEVEGKDTQDTRRWSGGALRGSRG
jgi:hypothetical protein